MNSTRQLSNPGFDEEIRTYLQERLRLLAGAVTVITGVLAAAFVVMFIKDTSLASQLGVIELTFAGKMLVNRGFSPVLGFGAILICYFALSYPLSRFAAYLEKRLAAT